MVSVEIEKELHRQLAGLSADQQQQVLEYARALKKEPRKGVKPEVLRPFIGSIPLDDLERMKAAIEADCERIDDAG